LRLDSKMDIEKDYSGADIGKYKLLTKLGNGGFGAVYKAVDRVLNAEKAIKILEVSDPRKAYELFNEAAIPYKCQHNNIIRINSGELLTFNSEDVFIVDMELANGASIDGLLQNRFVPVSESIRYIKDILFAVEFSHLKGIIHRDIKPANILLDNGIPKLSDFGLSTALGGLIIPWRWYRSHAAPETFVDYSVATVETDIFALGMTMFRMVNNISNWSLFLQNITNFESLIRTGKLIGKIQQEPYVPLKIQRIIRKACNPLPEKRYHSAAEMRNSLEKIHFLYNWYMSGNYHWTGTSIGLPNKDIYLEMKRKSVNVVVKNNGRRSSSDSRNFFSLEEAMAYLFEYIRETTIQ